MRLLRFLLPAILLLAMLPVNAKVNQPAITRYCGLANSTAGVIKDIKDKGVEDFVLDNLHNFENYILEFQLKDTTGLQNLLQYDDPLFRVGGKTLTGYSEYNMPSLTSENIENWILRRLDK